MRKNGIKDSGWIFFEQNRGKSVKISFLAEGGFFSQKKWGTNKIEYVCICHGHPWVSGQNSIPTLPNYHPPLLEYTIVQGMSECVFSTHSFNVVFIKMLIKFLSNLNFYQ